MTPKYFFEVIVTQAIKERILHAKILNCNYKFIITGKNGGVWILETKNSMPHITNKIVKTQCELTMNIHTFNRVINKESTPNKEFLMRNIIIKGKIQKAIQLGSLVPQY